MSLTVTEVRGLREAIHHAKHGSGDSLDTALSQLREMVLDGTYPLWINKAVLDEAMERAPSPAWDALVRELKAAPMISYSRPEDAYPHTPESYPLTENTPNGRE